MPHDIAATGMLNSLGMKGDSPIHDDRNAKIAPPPRRTRPTRISRTTSTVTPEGLASFRPADMRGASRLLVTRYIDTAMAVTAPAPAIMYVAGKAERSTVSFTVKDFEVEAPLCVALPTQETVMLHGPAVSGVYEWL